MSSSSSSSSSPALPSSTPYYYTPLKVGGKGMYLYKEDGSISLERSIKEILYTATEETRAPLVKESEILWLEEDEELVLHRQMGGGPRVPVIQKVPSSSASLSSVPYYYTPLKVGGQGKYRFKEDKFILGSDQELFLYRALDGGRVPVVQKKRDYGLYDRVSWLKERREEVQKAAWDAWKVENNWVDEKTSPANKPSCSQKSWKVVSKVSSSKYFKVALFALAAFFVYRCFKQYFSLSFGFKYF